MVKRTWIFFAFLALTGACFSKEICTTATEYRPILCRMQFPKISAIEIEENAARSEAADRTTDCSRFKIAAVGVRRYFSKAMRLKNPEDAHHTLDWLPCHASGTLRFADGKTARWDINQGQTGSVVTEGQNELFLYCPDCKFRPFSW